MILVLSVSQNAFTDFQGFCNNNNILGIESTKEEVGNYIISNQAHKSSNTYITVRPVHCLLGGMIKYVFSGVEGTTTIGNIKYDS